MLNWNKSLILAVTVFPLVLSGCAARYRTIHKELAGEASEPSADATPQAKPAGPSANVEVIVADKAVTQVKAGESFTIRPTASTVDPDNEAKPNCPNPGILTAAFAVSDGAALNAVRTAESCDQLQAPHTIATAGTYTIKMTVTTDENEKADASMTLIVTQDAPSGPGGFVITATPIVTHPNETVTFHGDCEGGAITWNYADTHEGQGADTTHAYAASGSYVVVAQCVRPSASSSTAAPLEATVTIVVIDKTPGTVTPPSTDTPTNTSTSTNTSPSSSTDTDTDDDSSSTHTDTDNDDDDPKDPTKPNHPGQTPGQTPGQSPGQSPTQTPYQNKVK